MELVISLTPTPPANELSPYPNPKQEAYPLNLMKCKFCDHLQLDTEISMFRLFKHYVYVSNTSSGNLSYFHSYAKEMIAKFKPKFVLDIGSNDGAFLHYFKSEGITVLGIDPAENICRIAEDNGIETECAFFNETVATNLVASHGKADLITCNNMFAHNRDLGEVLLGVREMLADNGTFIFEVSYALSMLKNNLFDLIYHEHFHYWHLAPAIKFLHKFGFTITDAELIPQTHGGSIRIYCRPSSHPFIGTARLKKIILEERVNFEDYLTSFKTDVALIREKLTVLLNSLLTLDKKVSILGYPAKACTLSYYFGLNDKLIQKVYDDNPLKIGLFTQQGQMIHPASDIVKDKPDYLLLLCWNYKEEILERYKFFRKGGGKFIVPLPVPEVI